MNITLADFVVGETSVRAYWQSHAANGAASAAVGGTIRIYKDGGTTEHTTPGITDTRDFDTLVGVNLLTIDTTADAFFEVGSEYAVLLDGATIDGQTVRAWIGKFTLGATDVYSARIGLVQETASQQHVVVPAIIFNGRNLAAADLANVQIRIFNILTGSDVVALTAMTQTAGEDSWFLTLTSGAGNLLTPGQPYAAELQFDHAGRVDEKTFREVLFRNAA